MMIVDEKNIEQMLKRKVEAAVPGAQCLKCVSPGCPGMPDRMILIPGGSVVFAEIKRPGEQPGPRQLYVHERLRKLGFKVCGCVDNPETVDYVVLLCKKIWAEEAWKRGKATQSKKEGADDGDSV